MKFQRRLRPEARTELIPMIDVVFQLVIFFMVSTTFIVTPGIGIVFPASATAESVVMTKLVVTVVSRNEVYLNQDRFDMGGLAQRLIEIREQEDQAAAERKTVVLEASEEIPYKLLIEVFDVLRKNDYKAINLKTRELPSVD